MVNSDEGMFDCTDIDEYITVGNGGKVRATKIGKKKLTLKQKDGSTTSILMKNVKLVPDLAPYNLFSITWALNNGFQLGNKGKIITLKKGDFTMSFDQEIHTKSGYLVGVEMVPRDTTLANEQPTNPTTQENSQAVRVSLGGRKGASHIHRVFGHMSEETTRKTAKYYDVEIQGKFEPCESCLLGKAKQKNTNKESTRDKSKKPGERMYLDISSIKSESYGGRKFWLLIVDEATNNCWSYFLKNKGQAAEKVVEFIKDLKSKENIEVKEMQKIRMDNAGENKKIPEAIRNANLNVKFEFTAPHTPQHNGVVERKFATLYGRIRSMFYGCGMSDGIGIRKGLWCECANTATKLENIASRDTNPPFTKFHGRDSGIVPHLRQFGEMGVVAVRKKIQGKMESKGVVCIFVGYAEDHSGDTYRMMNVNTKKIIMSRDVRWLNKMYGKWAKQYETKLDPDDIIPDDVISSEVKEVEDDENELKEVNVNETGREEQKEASEDQPKESSSNARLIRELARLGTWYNPDANRIIEEQRNLEESKEQEERINAAFDDLRLDNDLAFVMKEMMLAEEEVDDEKPKVFMVPESVSDSVLMKLLDQAMDESNWKIGEEYRMQELLKNVVMRLRERKPTNFQEAWNHKNDEMKKRWRDAIRKEFRDMTRRGVWKNYKKKDIPAGRQCIKNKWVFECKRSGVFRARLVACGYSQIPGVDFTESYAPVINDVTWRILLAIMILQKLKGKIIDVETAFLYGELEEEIYMESPEGLGHGEDDCVKLERSIYGLVQSARQYFSKFTKSLRKIGFTGGNADPCLMTRKNKDGVVYIAIYVDDCLLVGDDKAIESAIADIKKIGFVLKEESELDDYLSCQIKFDKERTKAMISQPHLIKKMEIKFEKHLKGMKEYKTPGSQGITIFRNPDEVISKEKHELYRSGTGMLLYLVKHTRPDIANAVRQLSTALDKPNEAAFKEMKRVIKFVIDTKHLSLKFEPKFQGKEEWNMVAYSDSDFAGNIENR